MNDIRTAIHQLDSRDPNLVIKGLNTLSKRSCETQDGSFSSRGLSGCIFLETYPELVLAIGSLLDVLNPLGEVVFRSYDEVAKRIVYEWTDPNAVLRLDDQEEEEEDEWRIILPGDEELIKKLSIDLDDNPMLLSLLNLIRNLSMDLKNEYLLASSAPIIRHLTALQYAAIYSRINFQATRLAIGALANIAHRIDITSLKRQQFHCYLDDSCAKSVQDRDFFKLRLSNHFSEVSTIEYVGAATALMAAVLTIISEHPWRNRYLLMFMLRMVFKLAQNPDNSLYISRCPQRLLDCLVRLLCINKLSDDPLLDPDDTHNNHNFERNPITVRKYERGEMYESEVDSLSIMMKIPVSGPARNSSKEKNLASSFGDTTSKSLRANPNGDEYQNMTSGETDQVKQLYFSKPEIPFFKDSSDHEIRDLALDALLALAQLPNSAAATATSASSIAAASLFTKHVVTMLGTEILDNPTLSMRERIINTPLCIQIVFRIANSCNSIYGVSASSSSYPIPGSVDMNGRLMYNNIIADDQSRPGVGIAWGGTRSKGSDKAVQLLELLLPSPTAQQKIRSIREDLIVASFSDDFIADVVCNKVMPVHHLAPLDTPMDTILPNDDGVPDIKSKEADSNSGLILKLTTRT